MNKITQIVLGLVLLCQFNIKAQGVDAYFYYSPFYAPGTGTYIETYIAFAGNSFHYILTPDSNLQASAEVTMLFKNVDDIKEYRKFKVVSPALSDTATSFPSFIDLQRIAIPEGVYNFDLIIKDNYAPDSIEDYKSHELLSVNIPNTELAFSGIEFLERYEKTTQENIYVKNGFECIPYVSDFFPEQVNYLRFYAELYNAAKELGPLEDFLFLFYIENSNTSKPIKEFSSFQKQKAQNVNVIFKEIDIQDLGTGNYFLVVEIRDRLNNIVLSKKKFFQRMNELAEPKEVEITDITVENTFVKDFSNRDTLAIYLSALRPICDLNEDRFIDNQLQSANLKLMQQFFYNFWDRRNEGHPDIAWQEYRQKLNFVEAKYKTAQEHGYAAPRGRIYLQYGSPNSVIEDRTESAAYPYEIWHYYKIADQTDKKFIFYNKSLMHNDYELLHSNMKGELSNEAWEEELYSRDGEWVEGNLGSQNSKAKDFYEGN
jgi:GWxTD domain-containing protein